MGPAWDVQGPGGQASEVSSWTPKGVKGMGRGIPRTKGQSWGSGSGGRGTFGWKRLVYPRAENGTLRLASLTSPHWWGLPCRVAGPSSGCKWPRCHGLAPRRKTETQGCSSPRVKIQMLETKVGRDPDQSQWTLESPGHDRDCLILLLFFFF